MGRTVTHALRSVPFVLVGQQYCFVIDVCSDLSPSPNTNVGERADRIRPLSINGTKNNAKEFVLQGREGRVLFLLGIIHVRHASSRTFCIDLPSLF